MYKVESVKFACATEMIVGGSAITTDQSIDRESFDYKHIC